MSDVGIISEITINRLLELTKRISEYKLSKNKLIDNKTIVILLIFTFINFMIIYYFYKKLSKKIENQRKIINNG